MRSDVDPSHNTCGFAETVLVGQLVLRVLRYSPVSSTPQFLHTPSPIYLSPALHNFSTWQRRYTCTLKIFNSLSQKFGKCCQYKSLSIQIHNYVWSTTLALINFICQEYIDTWSLDTTYIYVFLNYWLSWVAFYNFGWVLIFPQIFLYTL